MAIPIAVFGLDLLAEVVVPAAVTLTVGAYNYLTSKSEQEKAKKAINDMQNNQNKKK